MASSLDVVMGVHPRPSTSWCGHPGLPQAPAEETQVCLGGKPVCGPGWAEEHPGVWHRQGAIKVGFSEGMWKGAGWVTALVTGESSGKPA